MRQATPNSIRAARLRRKMTQAELARLLGVTKGAVCQWEQGRTLPQPRLAIELMHALPGLSLAQIYRRASAA
jgi:DNA-binding XRE family transcriptional regulator